MRTLARWLTVALVISGCASLTGDLKPRWEAERRILWLASEADVATECYRRGANPASDLTSMQGGRPIGCYDPRWDVIIVSDYRIGVPSAPGVLEHELRHRALKGRSWHR